jgi:heat shock protein HslJ
MTDLERAIKAELNRQSATAPSSASTEQFALSLIGPPDLSAATSRRHPGRRPIRDWLLSAIAVAVLGIPILTVAVIRSDRPSRDASQTPRVSTDPRDLVGVEWLLSKYVTASGVTQQARTGRGEATLRFDGKGHLDYIPGCNQAGGAVSISPGRLEIGRTQITLVACAEVEAMYMLSRATLSWQIIDHVLTIAKDDGRKLIFVVRPSIYPSAYPGSSAITIEAGEIGTANYRFYYGPAHGKYVSLGLEYRTAPGAPWGVSADFRGAGWT